MGLNSYTPGATRTTYLTLSEGKICQRVKDGSVQGSIARTINKGPNAGKEVFEIFHDSITARLDNIRVGARDIPGSPRREKGEWIFTLSDFGGSYELKCDYSSNYARGIINSLCSATPDQLADFITILPWKLEDGKFPDGKPRYKIGCSVSPGKKYDKNNKLAWRFGKDDMPAWEEVTFKGETKWDDTKQMAFLEAKVAELILPHLTATNAPESQLATDDVDMSAYDAIISAPSPAKQPGPATLPF